MIIKCGKCKSTIFKYTKIGRGNVWICWKERIVEDNSVSEGYFIKCKCGNVIGIDKGNHIKMKQGSFFSRGK